MKLKDIKPGALVQTNLGRVFVVVIGLTRSAGGEGFIVRDPNANDQSGFIWIWGVSIEYALTAERVK